MQTSLWIKNRKLAGCSFNIICHLFKNCVHLNCFLWNIWLRNQVESLYLTLWCDSKMSRHFWMMPERGFTQTALWSQDQLSIGNCTIWSNTVWRLSQLCDRVFECRVSAVWDKPSSKSHHVPYLFMYWWFNSSQHSLDPLIWWLMLLISMDIFIIEVILLNATQYMAPYKSINKADVR